MKNPWAWYWLAWLIIGFAIPETIALATNPKNTLSVQVWDWFGVKEGIPIWHWTFLHFVLLAFTIWLAGHFAFGLWR